jgi:hypothetical protein
MKTRRPNAKPPSARPGDEVLRLLDVLSRGEKLEVAGLSFDRDLEPAPAGRVQAVEIEQHSSSLGQARETP